MVCRYRALVLTLCLACFAPAKAAQLNEMPLRPGDRVGVLISTFDPLTTYHQAVIEDALRSGHLEYLVVVPTDFTPHKLRRLTMDHRQNMLQAAYKNHPRVIVTPPTYDFQFPQSRHVVKQIAHDHPDVRMVGVVLFGDLRSSAIKRRLAGFLTPVDEWLVLTPPGSAVDSFPERIAGKPVTFTAGESPASSSHARRYLKAHPEFYEALEDPSEQELPVIPEVRNYIKANRLYLNKPSLCSMFIDMLR